MTAQLHAAAVLDRLKTSGSPALVVFDGRVANAAVPPYVLVRFTTRYLSAGVRPDLSDLTFASRAVEVTARVYSVGGGSTGDLAARSARAITNRVAAALLDWTPTITGRTCSPMRHIDSFDQPVDEQTGAVYAEVVDDYRFTSHPD